MTTRRGDTPKQCVFEEQTITRTSHHRRSYRRAPNHTAEMVAVILLFVAMGLIVIVTTNARLDGPNLNPAAASHTHGPHAQGSAALNVSSPTQIAQPQQPDSPYTLETCITALNSGHVMVQAVVPLAQEWRTYMRHEPAQQADPQTIAFFQQTTSTKLTYAMDLHAHSPLPDVVCKGKLQRQAPSSGCVNRSETVSKQMIQARAILTDLHELFQGGHRVSIGVLERDELADYRVQLSATQQKTVDTFLGTTSGTVAALDAIDKSPQCLSAAAPAISGSVT